MPDRTLAAKTSETVEDSPTQALQYRLGTPGTEYPILTDTVSTLSRLRCR